MKGVKQCLVQYMGRITHLLCGTHEQNVSHQATQFENSKLKTMSMTHVSCKNRYDAALISVPSVGV